MSIENSQINDDLDWDNEGNRKDIKGVDFEAIENYFDKIIEENEKFKEYLMPVKIEFIQSIVHHEVLFKAEDVFKSEVEFQVNRCNRRESRVLITLFIKIMCHLNETYFENRLDPFLS